MTALAIDVSGLTKIYGGRKVVNDVELRLSGGRICGFLGPNGSGKTTTIRMLCGLLRPDAGSGSCLGLDLQRDAFVRYMKAEGKLGGQNKAPRLSNDRRIADRLAEWRLA